MIRLDPPALREQYTLHSRAEYETVLGRIVAEIYALLSASNLRFQIKQRVKDVEGYLKKLDIREDSTPKATRIEDLMGVRIVCPFLEDLDEVEKILSNHFDITEVDKKYQGQSFREFGYDATHLLLVLHDATVAHPLPCVPAVCEIQLRTILQDAWAEVEHELIYKSEWPIPTFQIKRKLAALNANLTLSDIIFQELREFQREILRKQSKRRSLADNSLELISKNEMYTALFDDDNIPGAHNTLEKVILDALSAHSEEAFDVAIDLYTRALEMPGVDSVRSILQNHRGMAYLALGNIDASHKEFLAAIESDPENYRAWYNLGSVLKSLQKLSSAQNAFKTCLRYNPSFHQARAKLIRLFLERGDYPNAKEALQEMKRMAPDFSELPVLESALADYRDPSEDR